MAVPYRGAPDPDLYQLLGVARDAPARAITQAWRCKARGAHPDSRPQDPDAAARFRVLEQAYRVLSHPARRAAYDQALRQDRPVPGPGAAPPAPGPAARAPLRVTYLGAPGATPAGQAPGPPLRVTYLGAPGVTPAGQAPGPPLRAGPVLITRPDTAPDPGSWSAERARLTALAELAARYLSESRSWPW